jgi:imidazolonepropionase-like amidohydrolase
MIARRPALAALSALIALAAPRLSAQTSVVFEGVHVIPLDRERVLERQTVVVTDGLITALGPSGTVTVPAGAQRVDGAGRYLIPGLAEMHAHIPSPSAGDQLVENMLFLYVAAGVTTIRGMLGHPAHLALRERAEAGGIVAPRIWTSGPSVNGNSVPTPDSAVRTVRHQRAAGYDFLKIHPGVAREVFDSLDAAADREGMRYAGHVPVAVGLDRAIEAGYWTIDHLDGYVEALAGRTGQTGSGWFGVGFTDDVLIDRIPELAQRTKAAGVWSVPTQTLMEWYATAETAESMAERPEIRYIPPAMRDQWITWKRNAATQQPQAVLDRWIAVRRALIKGLHDAGAGLLLGSDAPQVWNVPGFAIHRELEFLVASGLTPYEALVTGTRNIATYLETGDRAGTIAVGKQADLVLLEGNPLADIRHTTRRAGVMLRGVWHPQAGIERRLEAIATAYAADGKE